MSKPDTASGLFAKVVKFVRNPATSWSELDNKEPDRDEALSQQLLKKMIERKRRNDFVRKREFDMLRKMRQRDAMLGQDSSAGPSVWWLRFSMSWASLNMPGSLLGWIEGLLGSDPKKPRFLKAILSLRVLSA